MNHFLFIIDGIVDIEKLFAFSHQNFIAYPTKAVCTAACYERLDLVETLIPRHYEISVNLRIDTQIDLIMAVSD